MDKDTYYNDQTVIIYPVKWLTISYTKDKG